MGPSSVIRERQRACSLRGAAVMQQFIPRNIKSMMCPQKAAENRELNYKVSVCLVWGSGSRRGGTGQVHPNFECVCFRHRQMMNWTHHEIFAQIRYKTIPLLLHLSPSFPEFDVWCPSPPTCGKLKVSSHELSAVLVRSLLSAGRACKARTQATRRGTC
jgi:hypothetical protein